MLSNETISLIHFNLIQGVGLKTVQVLRDVFGSAERALQATPNELAKVDGLSPAMRARNSRRLGTFTSLPKKAAAWPVSMNLPYRGCQQIQT